MLLFVPKGRGFQAGVEGIAHRELSWCRDRTGAGQVGNVTRVSGRTLTEEAKKGNEIVTEQEAATHK